MKRILLIFSLFLIIFTDAIACGCDTVSFNKAIEADEIFVGKIVKVEFVIIKYYDNNPVKGWKYTFEVEKKWKGNSNKFIEIYSNLTSCDFIFDLHVIPTRHLVYAYLYRSSKANQNDEIKSIDNTYGTWLCSRTIDEHSPFSELDWFESDIKRLNKTFKKTITLYDYSIKEYLGWGITELFFLALAFIEIRAFMNKKKP